MQDLTQAVTVNPFEAHLVDAVNPGPKAGWLSLGLVVAAPGSQAYRLDVRLPVEQVARLRQMLDALPEETWHAIATRQ